MATQSEQVQPQELSRRESEFDVLSSVGERLVTARTPQEIVLWTQVRAEILRQDEEAADRKHTRSVEKTQLYGKLTLSFVAMIVGLFLTYIGYPFVGLFVLGAGLFWLAPDFVTSYFDKFKGKGLTDDE